MMRKKLLLAASLADAEGYAELIDLKQGNSEDNRRSRDLTIAILQDCRKAIARVCDLAHGGDRAP